MKLNILGLHFLIIFAVASAKRRDVPVVLVPLANINAGFYVANITVGNPPQPFTVGVATFLAATCVPSISCRTCKSAHYYDDRQSFSFQQTSRNLNMSVGYPPYISVYGSLCLETFNVGGLKVRNQIFNEITTQYSDVIYSHSFYIDGLISLNIDKNGIVTNMFSQNLISNPVAGYYISNVTGEISFGAPNKYHYLGKLNYFHLSLGSKWSLPVDNYTIDNFVLRPYSNATMVANFDISVRWIYAGLNTASQINNMLGAVRQWNGEYTFNCDTLDQYPSFSFIFSGQRLTLEPRDYTEVDGDKCISLIVTNNYNFDNALFVIGQPFFKKFYTVFDFGNERIGFAKSV